MRRIRLLILCVLCLAAIAAQAGGPLAVGGPSLGTAGQPFTWPAGQPIQYRVDGGPLSRNPSGVTIIDNATGVARVRNMFNIWQSVPTANISYAQAGSILPTGTFAGGDVQTVADFNAVDGSCTRGEQSPIVFDADGSLFRQLIGDPSVIGFANICAVNATGTVLTGEGVLNGIFQDGVNDHFSNFELSGQQFDQVFTHEFGHFSGLDHSQINVDVFNETPNACAADTNAGLPLMFPILICQARVSVGFPVLAPDDEAWISFLYAVQAPAPLGRIPFSSKYGIVHGRVLFSDGLTGAQGVNVIVRQVDDPATPQNESRRVAFSAVSGFRFTSNIGQSVTCPNPATPTQGCNVGGSGLGSRDTNLIGSFDIPVPAGSYTVNVESVDPDFTNGSSVGPLNLPIPMPGAAPAAVHVTVTPVVTTPSVDIKLLNTRPRFDMFESSQLFGAPMGNEVEGGLA